MRFYASDTVDLFLHAIATALQIKATVHQIDSAGRVSVIHVGTTENYLLECCFARTQALHIDPVLDNAKDVKEEMNTESVDMIKYHCPFCAKSFGGPLRLKRHISGCTPNTMEDRKPFQAKIAVTEESPILVLDESDTRR